MNNYNTLQFEKDLKAMNISLSEKQIEQFLIYYEMLVEWNEVMNLTAITEYEEVMKKHFLAYNISSQIFFKVLDYKEQVPQVVCMIQKEVAERIAEKPGTKTYGILSVLLQAWYDIEYLFTVGEGAFNPPPKVKSAVIRLVK